MSKAIPLGFVAALVAALTSWPDARPLQAQPAAAAITADLAAIPAGALGFVHVRLADVWANDAMKDFRKIIEKAGPAAIKALDEQFVPKPSTVARVTAIALPPGADGPEPRFVVALAFNEAFDSAKVVSAYLPAAQPANAGAKRYFVDARAGASVYFPDAKTMILGDEKAVPELLALQARGNGAGRLADAIRLAASGKPVVAAGNLKAVPIPVQAFDAVPEEFRPLTKAEIVLLTADFGKDGTTLEARITFPTADDATQAEKSVRKAADLGREFLKQQRQEPEKALRGKPDGKLPRPLEELPIAVAAVAALGALATADEFLADPPLKRDGSALTTSATLPAWSTQYIGMSALSIGLALPAVQKVRAAASRSAASNNLKQIAIAMHAYHDTYQGFPSAAIVDKKGKRLLSWRVSVLPYIEQDHLYKQFKLDEPWDSEHNKKLIPLMPKVYLDPRFPAEAGKTYYKAFVGKGAAFDWIETRKIQTITDGSSNTFMVGAAGDAVTWTKPDDFDFDGEKLPDLSKPFPDILIAFCDGSVRTFRPERLKGDTLKAYITASGGEVVNDD